MSHGKDDKLDPDLRPPVIPTVWWVLIVIGWIVLGFLIYEGNHPQVN